MVKPVHIARDYVGVVFWQVDLAADALFPMLVVECSAEKWRALAKIGFVD